MIETRTKTKTAPRPATRWRNRWRVAVRYRNCYNGEWVGPGEYWGAMVWPSKEIAEQIAMEDLAHHADSKHANRDVYVGAFPAAD